MADIDIINKKVSTLLTKVYNNAKIKTLPLDVKKDKIIVFSDLHRGVHDKADDFARCEKNYNAALGYYYESGYTLVILGDSEDLWECWPGRVMRTYADSLALESQFAKAGRYIRIFGNHDDLWQHKDAVEKYFSSVNFTPIPAFCEGIVFNVKNTKKIKGLNEIFLTHGHQGTLTSDTFAWIAKPVVRYVWRNFQRLTGVKLNTPAKDTDELHSHDMAMYNWASSHNGKLYLVAGHTHAPVFTPATSLNTALRSGGKIKSAEKRAYQEYYNTLYRSFINLGEKFIQCYFNTGCCSFSDGDITGIEIADGKMMLVRWPDKNGLPRKTVLDELEL